MCTGIPDLNGEWFHAHLFFVPTFQLYLTQVHYHSAWIFSKKQLRYYKYLRQQKNTEIPFGIVDK